MHVKKPQVRAGRRRAIVFACVLAVVVPFGLILFRQHLDASLREAVSQDDLARVQELLREGANARAVMDPPQNTGPLPLYLASFARPKPGFAPIPQTNPNGQVRRAEARSLLMAAVTTGDTDLVNMLLDGGADPHYALEDGRTSLFLCLDHYKQDCLLALLKHGARVDARNRAGQTPLHIAARIDSAAAINLLLDHGADPKATDKLGRTPLATAAAYRSGRAVSALLDRGISLQELSLQGTDPPLVWASASGPLSLVKRLWQQVRDPRQRAAQSMDALQNAVAANRVPVVDFLLSQGVSVHSESTEAESVPPSNGAAPKLARAANRTPLLVAAVSAGNPRLCERLLARGASVNAVDSGGTTPLIAAVRVATAVWALRAASAQSPLNSSIFRAAYGKRPAGEIENTWLRLVEDLLAKGSKINAVDRSGATALMCAYSAPPLLALLIEHGATVNTKDRNGRTALMSACQGPPPAVECLLGAGANPNDADNTGATPLVYALRLYRPAETPPIVRLLLKHGANPNAGEGHGQTILMLAKAAKSQYARIGLSLSKPLAEDIVSLLEKAGAKPGPENGQR